MCASVALAGTVVAGPAATETMAAKRAAREGRDLDYTPDFSTAPVVKLSAPTPTVADRDGLRARVLAVAEAIDGAADFESSGVGGQAGAGQQADGRSSRRNSTGPCRLKTAPAVHPGSCRPAMSP